MLAEKASEFTFVEQKGDETLLGPIQQLQSVTDAEGKTVFISMVLTADEAKIDTRDLG